MIEGLISQVRATEVYLIEKEQGGLEMVENQDIQEYVKTLAPTEVKNRMRALTPYYQFAGKPSLAKLAGGIREKEIVKTRPVFKLREFRGVNLEEVAKLESIGIANVEQILAAGKTPKDREALSKQTGVPLAVILELVKLSDLSRLGAIKSVRARLYYDAGLDTPEKFIK